MVQFVNSLAERCGLVFISRRKLLSLLLLTTSIIAPIWIFFHNNHLAIIFKVKVSIMVEFIVELNRSWMEC